MVKTRKVIIIIPLLITIFFGGYSILHHWSNFEVVTDIEVLNPEGTSIVFVVYHPGLSSFHKDVTFKFVEGLVSNDWRVEVTTASTQTKTDLANYDLLVIGSPVHGLPALPIMDYMESIKHSLDDRIVLMATGLGETDTALSWMKNLVEEANGEIIGQFYYWNFKPNERYGISDPMQIAILDGQQILPLIE